jgi:hypothetical protein
MVLGKHFYELLKVTGKVYEGIHTLPPSGFEPVTS